jgi:hypothetical protein
MQLVCLCWCRARPLLFVSRRVTDLQHVTLLFTGRKKPHDAPKSTYKLNARCTNTFYGVYMWWRTKHTFVL